MPVCNQSASLSLTACLAVRLPLPQGIAFTGFGLGDSNYTRYQYVPRAVRQRLLDLGAAEVGRSGAFVAVWADRFAWLVSRELSSRAGPGGGGGG